MPTDKELEKAMANLNILNQKREKYFQRMNTICNLAKKLSDENLETFVAMLSKIDSIYESFDNVIDDINVQNSVVPETSQISVSQSIIAFDEMYYFVKSIESKNRAKLFPKLGPSAEIVRPKGTRVKLPKIDLPKFNGDIMTWRHFKQSFLSCIHNNPDLQDIDKYDYLRRSLSGPPAELISTVPEDESGYHLLWASLLKQFDDERFLASVYLEHILEFSPVKIDTLSELQRFLSTFRENISALQKLNIPDLSQFILLHLGLKMLDSNTRYSFEKDSSSEKFPSSDLLISHVEKKCRVLQYNSVSSGSSESPYVRCQKPKPTQLRPPKVQSLITSAQSDRCPLCFQNHRLVYCFKFAKLTPSKRFERVKRLNLCYNCLCSGHMGSACTSTTNCKTCQSRHHTLIHFARSPNPSRPPTEVSPKPIEAQEPLEEPSTAVLQASATSSSSDVLLGTVQLLIRDAFGNKVPFRAILDSGSQRSFLSLSFVKRLGFQPLPSRVLVTGISSSPTIASKGTVKSVISPRLNKDFEIEFSAQVLPSLTGHLPQTTLPEGLRAQFCSLELADPSFDVPGEVHGLLGNEIFVRSILQHQPCLKSSPAALSTVFGFVIMGPLSSYGEILSSHLGVVSFLAQDSTHSASELTSVVRRFWDTEESSVVIPKTKDDEFCESHFLETHSRTSSGRYVVRLPFRDPSVLPSNNRQLALNRWSSQERRMIRDPERASSYHAFLQEYLDLGHMEPTIHPAKYTIPHHAVFKPDSTTSKIRVVFDASAKQAGELSLNDCLLPGPVLLSSLADIVCNFRLHLIGFTADISKMYRQVLVHPDDQQFQHIVWRRSPDLPLSNCVLKTVTYGMVSAPFLAIRSILQLGRDEHERFPNAARILEDDIYVDDVVSGADSVEEALQFQQELTDLCAAGGFVLQKWSSNSSHFVESVSSHPCVDRTFPLVNDSDTSLKILGIQWNPREDVFTYKFNKVETVYTKRAVLSDIARLFDPLGWISPVIFFAKCMLQKLWRLNLNWDEPIPDHLRNLWDSFTSGLPLLSQIRIPRYILLPKTTSCHVIGFCDASEAGYACAVYVRTADDYGKVNVSLLKARTKVAPLQSLTIPRLELCGALLLVRTLGALKKCLTRFPSHTIHLWTDSTIVLSWLAMEPASLKIFAAHRIAEINLLFPRSFWRHVSSQDNPSDAASRGLLPNNIVKLEQWWKGPSWLQLPPDSWPDDPFNAPVNLPELKPTSVFLGTNTSNVEVTSGSLLETMDRFSSLSRLVSSFAWMLRFCHNSKAKRNNRRICSLLQLQELRESLLCCVRIVQRATFQAEINDLEKGKPLKRPLQSLAPFIDSAGLLRVGGRLNQSALSWAAKHPLLIPKNSHLTKLLVRHYHFVHLHVGPQTLQSLISRQYWIVSGRSLIRRIVRECPTCFRFNSRSQVPLMGALPQCRVSPPGRAFVHVGVDFAGPFTIRTSKLRKAAEIKAYLAIFVCMATKALHLEIVSSLSTEAFLACLDRFMSRRGAGQHFYSDQGTNFIGAARQLKEVSHFLSSLNEPVWMQALNKREITWHFNPPLSPNFGGLWESGVKGVKTHLIRLTVDQHFTFEELTTIVAKIEAILNSRPLCPLSNDPNDLEALTPGHFLVGGPLVAIPEVPLSDVTMNRLKRWQLVQRIAQDFWKRWSTEYLHTLQQRHKWTKDTPNLKIGDLVLLKSSNCRPLAWTTGRVINTHEGSDDIVRVVTVRTSTGLYKRSVSSLVPFPPSAN